MKQFISLVIYLFFSLYLVGQETAIEDKITLNTGEIYVGKIILKTNDMIMLTTKDGTRYQFQLSEVKKTESNLNSNISKKEKTDDNETTLNSSNFGGIVELTGGVSSAKYCFGSSPNTQLSLMFGNRNLLGQNLFLGAGIGYNSTFIASSSKSIGFLPVFVRIQNTFSKGRTAPYLGMDAGYAFALNQGFGGGALVKLSAGISHKISYKTIFFAGIYAGIQSFSGTLTEVYESNSYSYFAQTTMRSEGIKIGLLF